MEKQEQSLTILTVNDLFIWSAWNLVQPFLAIWTVSQIQGAGAIQIGVGTMIYFIGGSLVTSPLGRFMDKHKGLMDETVSLALSGIVRGVAIIMMTAIATVNSYYLLQFILGITQSLDFIAWRVLFTHNIPKKETGNKWSWYSTLMAFGLGISSVVGGFITEMYDFNDVFMLAGVLTIIGGAIPLLLTRYQRKKKN